MRLRLAVALATASGFVALSHEILWFRVYAFLTWSRASTFGFLLGAYLLGLACGAYYARRFCRREGGEELNALAGLLFVANLAALLVIPFVAELGRHFSSAVALGAFAAVAALLGTSLPLLAHFGIPPGERVGARLSYLYLGNILGSAAGSLVTGFVLLDYLPLRIVVVAVFWVGMAVTGGALLLSGRPSAPTRALLTLLLALCAGALPASPVLFNGVYEKLTFRDEYSPGQRFRQVVENRSGVVTVDGEGTVRGGAVYDGKFNVDPIDDVNDIIRAYALFALRPAPKEVCVVGLGSGSWAQVIASHPAVEKVTAIEINPGYLEVIRRSAVVKSLLSNPKVEIVIDDGRRWLTRADGTFDAIIQNTTYHWRAHATNLLSREYLALCKTRLKPGGLLLVNTTHSLDALRTGLALFRHAWLLERAMYLSDAPLQPDFAAWGALMERFEIDGRRVVDPARPGRGKGLARLLDPRRWTGRAALEARTREAVVITDDNMASEWR